MSLSAIFVLFVYFLLTFSRSDGKICLVYFFKPTEVIYCIIELMDLTEQFYSFMPLFIALGDEVRLGIVAALSNAFSNGRQGLNVNEITQKTNLSRPAVSHHLKILKDAGFIASRQEGTSNIYFLTIEEPTKRMMELGRLLQKTFLNPAS